jgi:hypothetical protein
MRTPPLRARFYPMGFPVDIVTDSQSVLEAAQSVWSSYRMVFAERAVSIRVEVSTARLSGALRAPSYGFEKELLQIAQPPENYGLCNLTTGAAFARVTRDVADSHAPFVYYFLEPLAYIGLEALYLTALHSACVALDGRAVLLCGDSGAGKTSLAYACARRGWTYLSGDATHIVRKSPEFLVVGRPHQIRFRECAQLRFPELSSLVPTDRPNGRRDIEVNPQRLRIATAGRARADHIVFLNRTDSCGNAWLEPYPRERAARRWEEPSNWGNRTMRVARRESIERFLDLPLHQLTYRDAEDAEPALRSLLETSGQPNG